MAMDGVPGARGCFSLLGYTLSTGCEPPHPANHTTLSKGDCNKTGNKEQKAHILWLINLCNKCYQVEQK